MEKPEITEGEAKEIKELTLQRDKDVLPLVRDVFKILAISIDDMPLGALGTKGCPTEEEMDDYMANIYSEKFIPLLKESNIRLIELLWLFTILKQPVERLQQMVNASFAENKEIADTKLWGIIPSDIRIKDLDEVMESGKSLQSK